MSLRPLLLAALALGLTGCPRPAAPESTHEPGTASAPAQAPASAPPASEPGTQAPAAQPLPAAVYHVQVSGIRCITHPCPSYMARPLSPPDAEGIPVHELDLSPLGLSEPRREALVGQLDMGGTKLEGTLLTEPEAGPAGTATVFKATRLVEPLP